MLCHKESCLIGTKSLKNIIFSKKKILFRTMKSRLKIMQLTWSGRFLITLDTSVRYMY